MIAEVVNLQKISCYISPKKYIISKNSFEQKLQHKKRSIQIDRQTGNIKTIEMKDTNTLDRRVFSAFLGIFTIEQHKFLVFCDQATPACSFEDFQIYEISTIHFLSYQNDSDIRKCENRKLIYSKKHQLKSMLQYGFYFSYQYNLTQSYAGQCLGFKNKFTWNDKLLEQLKKQKVDRQWITPIIQGFVGQFTYTYLNRRIQYILISRRSIENAGTQFFNSGINQNGYVANFVGTQQIVRIGDLIMVDEQIRGSTPVFYTNKGSICLRYQEETNYSAFLKHIQKIKTRFPRIFCLNLLSTQNQQKQIVKQYQKCMKKLIQTDKSVKYYHFNYDKPFIDMSKEIEICIDHLSEMKLNLGYTVQIKKNSGKVATLKTPSGVVRTNCLDCIEKTGIFQMLLALLTFQDMLSIVDIRFMTDLVSEYFNESKRIKNQLVNHFVNLWNRNRRKLSYHYRGQQLIYKTEPTSPFAINNKALSRSVAKGRISRKLSIVYPLCSFQIHQMEMIDNLLGSKKVQNGLKQSKESLSNYHENHFSKKYIKTAILTWKIKYQIFNTKQIQIPNVDLLVIGLQGFDHSTLGKFKDSLNFQNKQMELLNQQLWKGNAILIYTNPDIKHQLKDKIQIAHTNLDIAIQTSKSAVYARLVFGNHSACFASIDLGSRKYIPIDKKISLLKSIHAKAFQNNNLNFKDNNFNIYSDDAVFLFGNLEMPSERPKSIMGNSMIQSNGSIGDSSKTKLVKSVDMITSCNNINVRQSITTNYQHLNNVEEFQMLSQNLLQQRQYSQKELTLNQNQCQQGNKVLSQVGRIWYSSDNMINWYKYQVSLLPNHESAPTLGVFDLTFTEQQAIGYTLCSPKLQQDDMNDQSWSDPLYSPIDNQNNVFSENFKKNLEKYFSLPSNGKNKLGINRLQQKYGHANNQLFIVDEQNQDAHTHLSDRSKIQDEQP